MKNFNRLMINTQKTRCKHIKSDVNIYAKKYLIGELLKQIATNRPQVITNQADRRGTFRTFKRPCNI